LPPGAPLIVAEPPKMPATLLLQPMKYRVCFSTFGQRTAAKKEYAPRHVKTEPAALVG